MCLAFIFYIFQSNQGQTVINVRHKKPKYKQFQIKFNKGSCFLKLNVNNVLSCTLLKEILYFLAFFDHFCQQKMRACHTFFLNKKLKIFTKFSRSFQNQIYLSFSQHFFKIKKSVLNLVVFAVYSVFVYDIFHF